MLATTQQTILATVAIFQLLVVAIAAGIALLQARSHIALRRFQCTLEILRFAGSKELSRARWFAYEHHQTIDRELDKTFQSEFDRLRALEDVIAQLSHRKLDLADYVYPISVLNLTGFMIEKNLVEDRVLLEELGSTFLRTWEAYKTFIDYRRKHRFLVNERLPPSTYGYYLEAIVRSIKPDTDK
jgi:hypothetical protein